jgi:hypothetical protein
LNRRLPDREHVGGKPRLEAMRAERAEPHRQRGEQRTQEEEYLQAGFLVFFFSRCGRFLP